MRLTSGSIQEDLMAPQDIFNPIDRAASERRKAAGLAALSTSNLRGPAGDGAEDGCEPEHARSSANCKAERKIAEKAARPATSSKYPWFRVEHIRDALRFSFRNRRCRLVRQCA